MSMYELPEGPEAPKREPLKPTLEEWSELASAAMTGAVTTLRKEAAKQADPEDRKRLDGMANYVEGVKDQRPQIKVVAGRLRRV
jgi:hypothetical protein